MLALLAPAKTLDLTASELTPTRPFFAPDAAELTRALAALPAGRLARVLKLRGAKADQARRWIEDFDSDVDAAVPAAHAFAGEVFRAFDGRSLSEADLVWAQDRVAILSALYGLLRPLDGIVAHRLEMSARLPTARGHNLYAFWGERITERINALTEAQADRSVVDLASQEYAKVLWPRSLAGPLIEVVFESEGGGAPRVIPTHARRARGLMARFVVEERIERVSGLRGFSREGYTYRPEASSPRRLTFRRP